MRRMPELSDRWRAPGFLDDAHAWIAARLAEQGRSVAGAIEQPHVTDWSTVMRVRTDDGVVWFKANDDSMRHEAAVTALLAPRSSGRVPAPLAADPRTGWMLLADAGQRLRDVIPEERSLERWHDVLEAYARLQLACEDEVDALLAAGLPDRRAVSGETIGELVAPRTLGQALSLVGALVLLMALGTAWRRAPDWGVPARWWSRTVTEP